VRDGPDSPVLPHPRLTDRAFVLQPLRDIAPQWRHPVSGRSIAELLESLPEGQRIRRLEP
jgi:2-amino-4-hydroxy-6-hydroxymethyldihydropteridine diphosphokinase